MNSPIWLTGFLSAVSILVFSSGIFLLNMQDFSMATKERNAVKMQVETFALDALDISLDTNYRAEGLTVLIDGSEPEVEAYVAQRLEEYDQLKSNVEDLHIEVEKINPGNKYRIDSVTGKAYQEKDNIEDFPYYKGKLKGKYKKIIRTMIDKTGYIDFSTDIFVRLNFIDKEDKYIEKVD